MEKIYFSAKFTWKLKFHGNHGKFTLTQWFLSFDKINKGYQNFYFGFVILIFPYPRKYATLTN